MTPTPPDKPLVDALAAVFAVGNDIAADHDTLYLVRMIRQLRASPQLAVVEAQQLVHTGDYRASRDVLEEAELFSPGNACVKAMLAVTMYAQGDSLWQAVANEARELPADPKATALLASLDQIAGGHEPQGAEAPDAGDGAALAASSMPLPYFGTSC